MESIEANMKNMAKEGLCPMHKIISEFVESI